MPRPLYIPDVQLPYRKDKPFAFEIVSNREILLHNLPADHDPFRPHRLHFYALLYIMRGSGSHYIDFKRYRYEPGSIIFISKDQVHAFEKNLDREAYFLLFTETFLARSSLSSNLMQQLSLYNYHLYPPVLQLRASQMRLFTELVLGIHEEFHGPDDELTEEIIQSSLKIFLCLSERIRKKNREDQPRSKYQEEFLQFQNLLKQHQFASRQVNFYAEAMNISPKKLNRITQEIMKQSAKSYIDEIVVIEMKRLLMNTSYTIKEIAYRAGFDDPTNFVKFFKKQTDMTPREFRQQF